MEDSFHIWTLITKKLSDEANASEQEELHQLLMKQPSWQYAYEMLAKWWKEQEKQEPDSEVFHKWKQLKEKIFAKDIPPPEEDVFSPVEEGPLPFTGVRRRRSRKAIAWVAGAFILLGILGVYLVRDHIVRPELGLTHSGKNTISEISTRYGSKSKITLPDGTMVWLNSGSNLFYDNRNFGESDREVTLSGEAFFNVTHDTEHPFIIHAGKINVQVLGTSFDVKNYPDDKTVEATLLKGSIEITFTNDPGRKVLLKPDEKLTVYDNGKTETQNLNAPKPEIKNEYKVSPLTILPEDSTVVETSWVQNKLAFSSETFPQLAVQMERWYNVKIHFSGDKVRRYRFTGIFEDETLDQALKALQITAPFHYKIGRNEVYISNP